MIGESSEALQEPYEDSTNTTRRELAAGEIEAVWNEPASVVMELAVSDETDGEALTVHV